MTDKTTDCGSMADVLPRLRHALLVGSWGMVEEVIGLLEHTECRSVARTDAERAFAMLAEHERDTVRNLALSMQEVGHIEEADVIFRAMGESDD